MDIDTFTEVKLLKNTFEEFRQRSKRVESEVY